MIENESRPACDGAATETGRAGAGSGNSLARHSDKSGDAAPFQVLPPLSDEELEALKTSVMEVGIVVPVVVDQHGRVLDGHHRHRIADELGLTCPVEIRHVRDDEDARSVALTLNAARRHLSREQRRELIRREITARPGDSDRTIARRLACSPSTVGAVRAAVSNLDTDTPAISTKEARTLTDQMRECFDDLAADVDALVGRGYPPMLLAAQLSDSILRVTADTDADTVTVNAMKTAFKPLFDRLFNAVFTQTAPSQEAL